MSCNVFGMAGFPRLTTAIFLVLAVVFVLFTLDSLIPTTGGNTLHFLVFSGVVLVGGLVVRFRRSVL